MSRRRWALVAAGGALGAVARWATLEAWPVAGGFPWPVFTLNLLGSAVVGLVMGTAGGDPPTPSLVRDAVGLGFCGGLTTFSTFAVEAVDLQHRGEPGVAMAYVVASVVAATAAVVVGSALGGHRSTAVGPPGAAETTSEDQR